MGFSRQEYWSGLPFPISGNLPNPGIKPKSLLSPALAGRFFTTSTTREAPSQIPLVSAKNDIRKSGGKILLVAFFPPPLEKSLAVGSLDKEIATAFLLPKLFLLMF